VLGAPHERAGFVCRKDALDNYFERQITQDMRRHLAAPFVMVMPDDTIGGFYTLSSTALRLTELPEDTTKRLPRYPLVPATLIGRLALDRRCHGRRWGSFLLLDALHRCATSDIASFAVVVDAIEGRGAKLLPARQFSAAAGFPVSSVPAHERHRGSIQIVRRRAPAPGHAAVPSSISQTNCISSSCQGRALSWRQGISKSLNRLLQPLSREASSATTPSASSGARAARPRP